MVLLQHLINGIALGSVYAIIALGYTMVYGIAKMLNFAHGDVIMVGGYVAYYTMREGMGLHRVPALAVAMLACAVLGVVIERLAYKPLRQAPSLAVLITAIGVSLLLQNVVQAYDAQPKSFPQVSGSIQLAGGALGIPVNALVNIVTCAVIMLALTWFTGRTKMGKAMRACSEDKAAAQLMGINVNTTISMTFAIGSALAAVAGVLYLSVYQNLMPTTGALPGIKAFTAAVLGGIGSIPGAFLGGVLLGIVETFAGAYISTEVSTAIVFAVLIVILLVKPAGLLGKYVPEKV